MKRSLLIVLVALVILSFTLVAAKIPPGATEKPSTAFYAKENCVVTAEGTQTNQDGWIKYRDRKLECTLTSADGKIAGTETVDIMGPRAKPYGKEHRVIGEFTLTTASQEWDGIRWGTIDHAGNINWVNGWAWTPEAGSYLRNIAWFRYDGANVNGWYQEMGTN